MKLSDTCARAFLPWTAAIVLVCGLCGWMPVQAQTTATGSVSGFVYDQANGEALIGANVFFKGTRRGVSTNINGYFAIPRVVPGVYTLVVDYIGYIGYEQEVALKSGEDRILEIRLQPKALVFDEVVIYADSQRVSEILYRKPISKVELNQREINAIPQIAEADLLRSLQTLPGVLPLSDYSSALYIRGGTPDQNLYLLDGTDVYNPEHAFGLFSTFNTDAIKNVELSKGGFGSDYGGRLSSVLEVTNLDGNREQFEGKSSISLLSAKTTLQMPLGTRGSLSGSLRRTYFDKTIAKAIDDIPDYYFYDGNLKAFFDLDAKSNLTVSAYGGRDFLDLIFNQNSADQTGFTYDWGNTTGSARYTRIFAPGLIGNFWLTGSRFSSDFLFGEDLPLTEKNYISDFTVKGNLEYYASDKVSAKFGFEQKRLHATFRQTFPGGLVDVDEKATHYAGYLQMSLRPNVRTEFTAGARLNHFRITRRFTDLAPRAAFKFRLTDTINLKASGGRYYQYLHKIPRAFVADIWTTSNAYQKQAASNHFIAGYQQELAGEYQLEIEAYYKSYENIYAFNQTAIAAISAQRFENDEPVYTSTEGLFNEGDGNTRGIELLLRKDRGIVTGWIGYSLARTEYTFADLNSGVAFVPRHDRTSTMNIVSTIDLRNGLRGLRGKRPARHRTKWLLGLNFVYSSGQPLTTPGSFYLIDSVPGRRNLGFEIYPGPINGFRLPHYARLDVSISFERKYGGWSLAPYLQIYNIGNRKNVWFIDYNTKVENSQILQEIETTKMFPLLPTLGVNFTF